MNVITLALTMATSSQTNLTGTPGRYYYKILMFVLFQQVITSSFVTSGLGASLPTLLLCKKKNLKFRAENKKRKKMGLLIIVFLRDPTLD